MNLFEKQRPWIAALLMAVMAFFAAHAQAAPLVSELGQLSVVGTDLVDEDGNVTQLRGMSTHALTSRWLGDDGNNPPGDAPGLYATKETIRWTRDSWGANVIRAAVYVEGWGIADERNWPFESPPYTGGHPHLNPGYFQNVIDMINWAIELDMYIIVDWHVLEEADPLIYQADAEVFFQQISSLYPNVPNILYEIVNEPNFRRESISYGVYDHATELYRVSWANHIKPYAEDIIPIIRANSPHAVVIVGTPEWDQKVMDVVNGGRLDPAIYGDVMYSLHFYACSHGQTIRDEAQEAFNRGLPIFVSEWGATNASGADGFCEAETRTWIDFLNARNISWVNWALSGKDESVSVFKANTPHNFTQGMTLGSDGRVTAASDAEFSTTYLTEVGVLIKCLMSEACDGGVVTAANGTINLDIANFLDLSDLNDYDNSYSYVLVSTPLHGTVAIASNIVTYSPGALFTGSDSFTYRVINAAGVESDPATITVIGTVDPQECDAPAWQSGTHYPAGTVVSHNGIEYRAVWYINPSADGLSPNNTFSWGPWTILGECGGSDDHLTVSTTAVNVGSNGGAVSVSVSSNIGWSVTENLSWVTVTASTTSGNGSLNVVVAVNSGSSRTGTFTVTGGGITHTITVTQAGISGGSCGYQITAQTHQWHNVWNAQLTIRNTSGAPLNGWSVILDYANSSSLGSYGNPGTWDAEIQTLSAQERRYQLTNKPWNGSIPAGGSVVIHLNGTSGPPPQAGQPLILADVPSISGASCGN